MRRDLSVDELTALAARGRVLQSKHGVPAVIAYREADGERITKMWTRRANPSSDWFRPYADRFRRNAARLRARGINAPEVVAYGRVVGTNRRYVSYRRVTGESLRKGRFDPVAFAAFVAELHRKGIYFRSLHLGNVLATATGYALIDVTDVSFRRRALSVGMRARNLSYLLSYPADSDRVRAFGTFSAAYRAASALRESTANRLERAVARSLVSRARG